MVLYITASSSWTLFSCFPVLQTSRPLLLRKSMYKDTDIDLEGKAETCADNKRHLLLKHKLHHPLCLL